MKFELGYTLSEDAIYARDTIKDFIKRFEPYFAQKLEDETKYALVHHNKDSADVLDFYNQIAIRGGKRIRASLSYYTYKMLGGKNEDVALELARAIEMIHAYLLVIDDFTDKSDTRRGGPTAHVMAEKYLAERKFARVDPYHHGAAMAITAALLQLHKAEEVILDLDVPDAIKIQICQNVNSKIATTAYGQITDAFNSLKFDVPEGDVFDMLEWKTGVYTFENPLHSGALLANANSKELLLLTEYAIPVGIAFQIHDDVIGMFGDSKETGKSNKDDLMEGKMTLLIQHALKYANSEQIKTINTHLGNRRLTEEDHATLQHILIDCGSFEYSKQTAIKLVEKGKEMLSKVPSHWDQSGTRFLRGIADYIIQRSN